MINPFATLFGSAVATVKEINRKYKRPRIKMTSAVKFALFCLRLYLFLLIGLMIFKFITALK